MMRAEDRPARHGQGPSRLHPHEHPGSPQGAAVRPLLGKLNRMPDPTPVGKLLVVQWPSCPCAN
jgi:hypothetical protein